MYEEVCYEKPYLREVVARIDFVSPVEGMAKALPARLANVISEHFQISEPIDAVSQEFEINNEGVRQQKRTLFKQWNFFGKEREKQLSVSAPFMFVTFARYMNFEAMKEDWNAVVQAVAKAFPDARAGRFGLRYINSIEIEDQAPTAWDDLIAPGLLAALQFFNRSEHLTRLIQVVGLKYGNLDVQVQFGMPNPDFPAVMKRAAFVLDFDGYVQTAHELAESLQHMEDAHARIQDLFEKSITDRLRERMNVLRAAVQN
jgi:uncharacterized protein (TIGR04255 family)